MRIHHPRVAWQGHGAGEHYTREVARDQRSEGPVIGIAGAGRVARAIGAALGQRGMQVVAIASRDRVHAERAAEMLRLTISRGDRKLPIAVAYSEIARHATHVIVAVADSAIAEVARTMAEDVHELLVALHTSGNYGAEALAPLAARGVACGAMHPLQTFAGGAGDAAALLGIGYAISGDDPAVAWARQIAHAFAGRVLNIAPAQRPLYHAAAVMASNYIAVLLDAARELMVCAGVAEDTALQVLAPLARRSLENALALGPLASLTGPVARGDAATVAAHTRALEGDGSLVELYRAAAVRALSMARRHATETLPPADLPKRSPGNPR